ncbi:hypothetical protein [Virgibacillus salexigens]|uniref:hypothetical protein n=1 Tax=Virgibacillus salexigens TaxID=61016 RepID=UPI0003FA78B5|nr:hypothetical protein [Virgibacillus salexigens]
MIANVGVVKGLDCEILFYWNRCCTKKGLPWWQSLIPTVFNGISNGFFISVTGSCSIKIAGI